MNTLLQYRDRDLQALSKAIGDGILKVVMDSKRMFKDSVEIFKDFKIWLRKLNLAKQVPFSESDHVSSSFSNHLNLLVTQPISPMEKS